MMMLVSTLLAAPVVNKIDPLFEEPVDAQFHFGGFIGQRLVANLERWELRVPASNPAMLEIFFDRESKPGRNLLPWHGEFVGKYLCASILSYKILRNPAQKALIEKVMQRFLESQGPDGYLGPFDHESRLIGMRKPPSSPQNWDVWGHYWAIRALLLYYKEFGDPKALQSATRAADLIVKTYLNQSFDMRNDGGYGQMNYAVIHAFALLYRLTEKPQYLEMANWIVNQWDQPEGPLYLRMALTGYEMHQFPANRWESLHDFLGIYEMALLTGDPKYSQAFTHIWYSILKGDRHNTGGFSSGERTTGNPYDTSSIETCSTVGWIDMSIAMLKFTGNPLAADEIELTTFNGNIGGQSPSGSWWTYTTPMEGIKEASAHTIHFQCRAGSPELNCCSVNGPRGMVLMSEWALLRSKEGVVLNYYGPSEFKTKTPGGQMLTLHQDTDYPVNGKIMLRIRVPKSEKFELKLRIPSWSLRTQVGLNGSAVADVKTGSYLSLIRDWKDGDCLSMDLDMSFHYWVGERESIGKTSIYRGPILLAYDPAFDSYESNNLPEFDARNLRFQFVTSNRQIQPWILIKVKGINGTEVTLCDFASAGAYGNPYKTWLKVADIEPVHFSKEKPIWANRPTQ